MSVKVSIVIPCYNMGNYILETIESVESCQNKADYEVIIVNDGSTDLKTIEILKGLESKGYYVINQPNMGLSTARNNGIKAAKGDYILPLDADNKIRPEYISISIAIFENKPEIGVVYGDAMYFEKKTGRWQVGEFDISRLLIGSYIDACACFRKSVWEKVGGYDEDMRLGVEDWDFWIRVASKGVFFHYENQILFDYRVRENSMVVETGKHFKLLEEYIFNKKELYYFKQIRTTLINLKQENKSFRDFETFFMDKSYYKKVSISFLIKLIVFKIKIKIKGEK